MQNIEIKIEDYHHTYKVSGDVFFGPDEVLLDRDDDLTKEAPWANQGFTVQPFLSNDLYNTLVEGIRNLLFHEISKLKQIDKNDFILEQYHKIIGSDSNHLTLVRDQMKHGLLRKDLPIDLRLIEKRVSEICGIDVTAEEPVKANDAFYVRIIRPKVLSDNNPPHRDTWLDRLRNAVNIYVPLAGSNSNSSLPILPYSHKWKESVVARTKSGGTVNGNEYSVPAVAGSKHPLKMIRPNPGPNEIMVFSPYLVHGGGINLNDDITRMSLEMRFWRKKA